MAHAEVSSTPKSTPGPSAKARARTRLNRVMKLVRRAHLYAGLFMTPWVFLYGVSAVLFNHPDALPDQPVAYFAPSAVVGASPTDPSGAAALAERVVAALNVNVNGGADAGKGAEGGRPTFRLVRPEDAAFNRDLIANARGEGRTYNVRVDLLDGSGSVREVAKRDPVATPTLPKGGVKLVPAPFEPVLRRLPATLKSMGLPADEATVRSAPDLAFLAEGQGRLWRLTYNGQNGLVSGRPADARAVPPTTRRSLLLMHVAHGFPSRINARWVWGIAVDVMAVSMVGWGITGLLMWWQMKNLRTIGAVVLLASLIAATIMALAMHATFVAENLN